jgi:transcriptional regulator with PAS, ATPase and Fis domain
MTRTHSTLRDERGTPTVTTDAYLVMALHAHDLGAAPTRHRLEGLVRVELVRAETWRASRTCDRAILELADAFMSSRHAHLRRYMARWLLADDGSRNGTWVNGERVREHMLADGDVIEVGHTFLVYREGPRAIDELDGAKLRAQPIGLATLSPTLAQRFAALERIARSGQSVLIGGETGTGKELVARAIHTLSGRTGAFVAVNCGALPETLAEAELFGHRRGAFSGAVSERAGLVRAADRGTLFLDEVADLRLPSQASLLRVLQERQVVPLGAEKTVDVDVRFVAATHVDLVQHVAAGEFRVDLHARLCGFELELPPLRARREDLGLLVRALLLRHGARSGLSALAARALFAHDWPGNVRELEQVLGSALALAGGGVIDVPHLPAALVEAPARLTGGVSRSPAAAAQRDELVRLLQAHGGNIAAVCREIGKGRQQIHRWLKRFELDPDAFRR